MESTGENSNGMDTKAGLAEGLRLIERGDLKDITKELYGTGWRRWVRWCEVDGVDPLTASWEDVLGFLRSIGDAASTAKGCISGVSFVYRARGGASPSDDRRLAGALGKRRNVVAEDFSDNALRQIVAFQADYLAWCGFAGKKAALADGRQVAEFLSGVGDRMSHERARLASTAVSLYLVERGHAPTEFHPAVEAVLRELRERWLAQGGADMRATRKDGGNKSGERAAKRREQWRNWREDRGIEAGTATPADVLDYLREHEHEVVAGKRLSALRNRGQGDEEAFWSEEVERWLEEFKGRLKRGEVPGRSAVRVRKTDAVLAEWFAARAGRVWAERAVPVGLTREELERTRVGKGRRLEKITMEGHAYIWAAFSEWRDRRGIPLNSVEPVHIRVYLEEVADRMNVGSLWSIVNGIAFGFDEYGFSVNPTDDDEVFDYLYDLEVERKESQTQMDPIREAGFKAILESAYEPRPWERKGRAEFRGALTVSLVRIMFDGLLRGSDAGRARWGDLSRSGDGTGSLLLPRSKTDKYGRGESIYVSGVAFEHLDRLHDLRRCRGEGAGKDELIFGVHLGTLGPLIKKACADAGLVGRFGTHSMRIGAAQELALAGFSLPMIMLAGRWASPGTVKLYIRNIKVGDSAMAELQRMLATGRHRVGPDARGIDVMSCYDTVKFVR